MKKLVLAVILTAFSFGCSTHRKVNKEKIDSVSELEASREVKTGGTSVSNTDVKYDAVTLDYEFIPIDADKPMELDGKKYVNAKVKASRKKETATVKNEDKKTFNKVEKENVKEKIKIKTSKKEIDKKGQSILNLYLIALALLVLLFLAIRKMYLNYKKLNPIV